ncbi:DNA RNA-binding Alba [Babesia ovis]|uniref:DNA RNA-binding Alba n=1 Tax=Babesia ovis TaxID=5869 RepID=A0A9W5T7U2_BABOV|nr:DNA RNA-binding Alba [Babesia ovis]
MANPEASSPKEMKPTAPGEIRVTSLGLVYGYVNYAKKLIAAGEPVITLRGTGRAMSNVVETAEILRRAYKGMHQLTTLDTQDNMASDQEDEEEKDTRRSVCFLTIKLTLDPEKIDIKAPGYQKPLTDEELKEVDVEKLIQNLKTAGIRRKTAVPRKQGNQATNAKHSGKK